MNFILQIKSKFFLISIFFLFFITLGIFLFQTKQINEINTLNITTFETNNYEVGWDGKLKNGSMLPPDVYSYKIIYNTNLGEEKKETGKIIMAR